MNDESNVGTENRLKKDTIPHIGRVALEYGCKCGKKGYVDVSGWQIRANALRDQLEKDKGRNCEFMKDNLGGDHTADIDKLMNFLRKEEIPQGD